jgi:hypothetical protein
MTALAGVAAASPSRTLAAIPATVADLIERHVLGCMVILLILLKCRVSRVLRLTSLERKRTGEN